MNAGMQWRYLRERKLNQNPNNAHTFGCWGSEREHDHRGPFTQLGAGVRPLTPCPPPRQSGRGHGSTFHLNCATNSRGRNKPLKFPAKILIPGFSFFFLCLCVCEPKLSLSVTKTSIIRHCSWHAWWHRTFFT